MSEVINTTVLPKEVYDALTPSERRFWLLYVNSDFNGAAAYWKFSGHDRPTNKKFTSAPTKKDSTQASNKLRKIYQSIGREQLLEASGLGVGRLMKELGARLNAMTTKHYKGEEIGVFEDNSTRMKATELLSRLTGLEKQKVELSGENQVSIYLPDNGRGDRGEDANHESH